MRKDKVKKDFDSSVYYEENFIDELYNMGYVILSPDESEKVDQCIALAHLHGMNPFDKPTLPMMNIKKEEK